MMERANFSSTSGLRFSFPPHSSLPTSSNLDSSTTQYFERTNSDDLAELNACRLMIDSLQQRVNVLEKINLDLETRLERQAIETMDVERQILEANKKLRMQEEKSSREREEWTAKFLHQESKSERLRDHLSRTERELYGILQKKYELMRGPVGGAPSSSRGQSVTKNPKSWENFKKEDSTQSLPASSSDDFLATLQVLIHFDIQCTNMLDRPALHQKSDKKEFLRVSTTSSAFSLPKLPSSLLCAGSVYRVRG